MIGKVGGVVGSENVGALAGPAGKRSGWNPCQGRRRSAVLSDPSMGGRVVVLVRYQIPHSIHL